MAQNSYLATLNIIFLGINKNLSAIFFSFFFTFLFSSSFYLIHKRIKGLFDICFFKRRTFNNLAFPVLDVHMYPEEDMENGSFLRISLAIRCWSSRTNPPFPLANKDDLPERIRRRPLGGPKLFSGTFFLSRHGLDPIKSLSRKKSALYFKWPLFLMKQ